MTVTQSIKKIHMTALGSGDSDPGAADGQTVSFTKTYPGLPSGGSRVYRGYVDGTTLPTPSEFYKAALELQADMPAGMPFLITDAVFGGAPHSDAIFARIQTDGGDLRMFEETGLTTPMPVDLVSINAAGDAIQYWSKSANAKAAASELFARYGTDLDQPDADASGGSEEVWSDYQFAAHDPLFDVSGNFTFTNTGTVLGATAGPFGGPARGFNTGFGTGTGDKISLGHSTLPTTMSFSAWVYLTEYIGDTKAVLCTSNGAHQFRVRDGGQLELIAGWSGGQGIFRGGSVPLDTWTHVAFTYDSSSASNSPILYVNGVAVTLATNVTSSGTLSATSTWLLGSVDWPPATWKGYIAEPRCRADILSAAFIAAEYLNQADATDLFLAQVEAGA